MASDIHDDIISIVDIRVSDDDVSIDVRVVPWQGAVMADYLRRVATSLMAETNNRTH